MIIQIVFLFPWREAFWWVSIYIYFTGLAEKNCDSITFKHILHAQSQNNLNIVLNLCIFWTFVGNGNGVVGKKTYLEGIITSIPTLGAGQSAFTIHFEWDADMGIPGAFLIKNYMQVELFLVSLTLEDIPNQGSMHFVCNSWVYNSKVYEKDRIFFASEVKLFTPRNYLHTT